jgi:hypothetical protein
MSYQFICSGFECWERSPEGDADNNAIKLAEAAGWLIQNHPWFKYLCPECRKLKEETHATTANAVQSPAVDQATVEGAWFGARGSARP